MLTLQLEPPSAIPRTSCPSTGPKVKFSVHPLVSTAHCEVAEPVREAYRELHRLPTYPPEGVRYYSGAWGRAYGLNQESAADAITACASLVFV